MAALFPPEAPNQFGAVARVGHRSVLLWAGAKDRCGSNFPFPDRGREGPESAHSRQIPSSPMAYWERSDETCGARTPSGLISGGTGFAVLGAQLWLMNARIDQLATKVNGIDTTFGVKLEETNAKLDAASTKLDAISQRLPAEFKTIGAEIAAQTS